MTQLCETVVTQCLLSHSNITGNKEARFPGKNRDLPQLDLRMSYDKAKTVIKAKHKMKWERWHPGYQRNNLYHQPGRK